MAGQGGKVIDWISLEVEYINSSMKPFVPGENCYKDRTEFFKSKGIPHSTWNKQQKIHGTWDFKREFNLRRAAEIATQKAITKRALHIEKSLNFATMAQELGTAALMNKNSKTGKYDTIKDSMVPKGHPVKAFSLIQKGLDIEKNVLELEQGTEPDPTGLTINGTFPQTYNESDAIAEIESLLGRFTDKGRTA